MRKILLLVILAIAPLFAIAKKNALNTPPMGFMTWNYFGLDINEADIRSLADAMTESGLRDVGYTFIFIDDGWQGGRDNRNNIIPDPEKFPSGMKALADYVHEKGMKIGIYSDAAPLTCGGFTGSLHFEEQDAATFAKWGIDYLKYDYCGAPTDRQTAIERYTKMSKALAACGRDIILGICEWGMREPWLWGVKSGGQLWRTTGDVVDKWKSVNARDINDMHGEEGFGILDIVNVNAPLHPYAGPGGWNDPDMLVVGLYGKQGIPSSHKGGVGCTDTEYQSQMSLWCLMAAPLMISCDVREMSRTTREILTNKEAIAVNQDPLGRQAERKINSDGWQVFVKPLANGDVALGILNCADQKRSLTVKLNKLGITGKKVVRDLWSKDEKRIGGQKVTAVVDSHETKLLRLSAK